MRPTSACSLASLVLALALAFTGASDAYGQETSPSESDREAAREAYAAGERYASEGAWAEAAASFDRADQMAPNDVALDAAIEAATRADDPALVMNLTERAERAPSAMALPVVASAKERFGPRASLLLLPCLKEALPCTTTVDGVSVGSARHWVAPGPHTVVLGGTDAPTGTFEIDAIAGQSQAVEPQEAKPKPRPRQKSPPPPDKASSDGLSPFWIVVPGALTAGFLVTGLVAGAQSSGLESDLEALQAQGNPNPDDPDVFRQAQQELVDDGTAWSTTSNVFFALTGAAAAATAVVAIVVITGSDAEEPPVTALVAPRPGGATAELFIAF